MTGQNHALGPIEERSEAGGDAPRGIGACLAATRAHGLGRMLPRPRSVRSERATFERAEADLVESRLHDDGDAAAGECEREGVGGATEARADAELDRLRREHGAERYGLLGTLR